MASGQSSKGEQTNYLTACIPVHFWDLPAQSNLISSNFFFSIKQSSDGHLKLKCHMVPHGNLDREKAGATSASSIISKGARGWTRWWKENMPG
jgi:hypothetical protein